MTLSYNSREKARNAVNIIKMEGQTTLIADPENPGAEPRKFTFDYSYWSHDGFKELEDGYLEPDDPTYSDQVLNLKCILLECLHTNFSIK